MKGKKASHSIQWKIILLYCMLVFIATTIIGVFLINQLEEYYVDSIRTNMEKTVTESTLISSISNLTPLKENEAEIQKNIGEWGKTLSQEIFVVDNDLYIIASTNANKGKSAVGILDNNLLLHSISGKEGECIDSITSGSKEISVMNKAFPIKSESGKIEGALYMRADMSAVEKTVEQSKKILMQSMLIALLITFVLSYFISKSITEPINDVTQKAEIMAGGDFSHEVGVKSDDEIGRLAEMLNYLRVQLDDALSQISGEKNKLETVLKHIADGLIAIDLSGKIIHLNEAAINMLKASQEELEKGDYDSIIVNINKELTIDKLKKSCEEEQKREIFEADGYIYDARFDRFRDENGEEIGVIMVLQDITERTKLENMQMDFVANVSHELKTPLTTIKSYTETLLDGALEEADIARSFLGIIDLEADRMNRLVKELLQLSRMENKQEKWNVKEDDLVKLILTAVTKINVMAENKGQRLNCLFNKQKTIPVLIDRDRIEQVFLNIVSNAIKYTQEGGRIDIDILTDEKEVMITVLDNGIGIPANELGRVFERFFRVDKARSRDMGGTGLGLSISKQIVDKHGGRIAIDSKEGSWTKATITLPLVKENE